MQLASSSTVSVSSRRRLPHGVLFLAISACLSVACGGGTTPTDSGSETAATDVATLDAVADTTVQDASVDAVDAAVRDAVTGDVADANTRDAAVDATSGDTATTDTGSTDSGSTDTGASTDVASTCPTELGAPCSDTTGCTAGLECNVGRCSPQGRPLCGGFAGARCTDSDYSECLYYSGADFGTCVRPSEARCLCMRAPMAYSSCP